MMTATAPSLFGFALAASALGGALGMASGIFIVPILTLLLGMSLHVAVGASIVSVIACSCGGAAPFLRQKLTNIRLALVLETATTLGAASGVLLAGRLPVAVLYAIFAAVLAISAGQMLMQRQTAPLSTGRGGPPRWADRLDGVYPDAASGDETPYQIDRLGLGLVLMYGAGLLSAMLGIGSGVLKIPAMDSALRLPIKVSSATSNFMIGVTAAASASAYLLNGSIIPAIAAPVALGSVVGARLGASLLRVISPARLRIGLVILLLAVAAQMAMAAINAHGKLAT